MPTLVPSQGRETHPRSQTSDSHLPEGRWAFSEIRGWHAAFFVLTIAVGLYVDQRFEIWGQIAASVWCWAALLAFMHGTRGDLRLIIMACLVWATLGEIVASLVWGLYLYRLHNVPMFIPPGHVLMLLVALYLTARLRSWVFAAAPAIAAAYAVYATWKGIDMLSVVLTPIFILGLVFSRSRNLYAATFLLALPLEFYGTWMGNWRWEPQAPWLELSMANPPVCIGAVYCARDALAGLTVNVRKRWRARAAHSEPDEVDSRSRGATQQLAGAQAPSE